MTITHIISTRYAGNLPRREKVIASGPAHIIQRQFDDGYADLMASGQWRHAGNTVKKADWFALAHTERNEAVEYRIKVEG